MRNKIKKISLLFLLSLGISPVWSQVASMQEYYQEAMSNSDQIKALEHKAEAMDRKKIYMGGLPDPMVMVGLGLLPVETRLGPQRGTVSVSQMIPGKGKLKSQVALIDQEKVVIQAQINDLKSQITRQVSALWLTFYKIDFEKNQLQEQLAWYEELMPLLVSKVENGTGSQVDYLQLKTLILETKRALSLYEESNQKNLAQWRALMGNEQAAIPQIPAKLDSVLTYEIPTLEEVVDQNVKLKLKEEQIKTAQIKSELAGLSYRPDFTIGATYINVGKRSDMDVPNNGKDAILLPQVSFKIPLNKAKNESFSLEQEHYKSQIESEKSAVTKELQAQYENLIAAVSETNKNEEVDTELIELLEQTRELMLVEYINGKRRYDDLIRVHAKLIDLHQKKEMRRMERAKACFELQFLSGLY